MKLLCITLCVIASLAVHIQGLPVDSVTKQPDSQQQQQIAVPLPAIIKADLPAENSNGSESLVAVVPLSLLDVEATEQQSATDESAQRTARGLGGLGGLGKFGGFGLGLKGFGGWGLGGLGLHGLGLHGLGFKPFFKHFG